MSECAGCGDGPPVRVGGLNQPYDLTEFDMPRVFHAQYPVEGHPLQALQFTLPPHDAVQRQFQRPFFHPDGSIEYPKLTGDSAPPNEIEGYQRDAANPWRFTPLWPDCTARYQGTRLLPNGCINVHMLCNNPEAERFQHPVRLPDCAACLHKKTPPQN